LDLLQLPFLPFKTLSLFITIEYEQLAKFISWQEKKIYFSIDNDWNLQSFLDYYFSLKIFNEKDFINNPSWDKQHVLNCTKNNPH
jgi:hypothetical protein